MRNLLTILPLVLLLLGGDAFAQAPPIPIANGGTGHNNGQIDLLSQALTQTFANDPTTGTTTGFIVKQTATGLKNLGTGDTNVSVAGICLSGCGTTGSAYVAMTGTANCVFDNGTTTGDYVITSVTSWGQCHDAGTTLPRNLNILGLAASTNVGAGTYPVDLGTFGAQQAASSVSTTGSPANGNLTKFTGSTTISNGDLSGDCTTSGTLVTSCTGRNEKCVTWDSTLQVTAQVIEFPIEWTSYTLTSLKTAVNGGGSFTVAVAINGTPVTGLSAVSVSGTTNTVTNATGANTGAANDQITLTTSSPTGTVDQAYVCPVFTHSVN